MSAAVWHIYGDAARMARAVADALQDAVGAAVDARGHATLGLAGGSTPMAAYADLAARALPWPQVSMALIDERFVPEHDPQSNAGAIRRAFAPALPHVGLLAGLYHPAEDIAAAAAQADADIRARVGTLDAVLIGMGADGHIASLFAESPDYEAAMSSGDAAVRAIRFTPPSDKADRLSFTLPRLLAARTALVCITGADKREVLERSLDGRAPHYAMARFLAAYRGPLDIFWSPA